MVNYLTSVSCADREVLERGRNDPWTRPENGGWSFGWFKLPGISGLQRPLSELP